MTCETSYSPVFDPLSGQFSFSSSIATSASASWSGSDTASQTSDDTSFSISIPASEIDLSCFTQDSACREILSKHLRQHAASVAAVPVEQRQNPRRTAAPSANAPCAAPPSLVRQADRKVNFVDSLVDSSTQIVEAIWPLSSTPCRLEPGNRTVLPLRTFIQETLRRSRTSYSTLQVALYYLILIKPHVPKRGFTAEQIEDRYADRALQCGRRMFLAALILASKYLQDRNYSARAWSKISGLAVQEINQNEVAFLLAVNWKLHITDDVFQRWTEIVLKHTPPPPPPSPGAVSLTLAQQTLEWKQLILKLNPDLTNIEGLIPALRQPARSTSDLCALSPRSILNLPQDLQRPVEDAKYLPPMEPVPTLLSGMVYSATPGQRPAPAMSLLPTPRLTPQAGGICTPAASVASHLLGRGGAMGMAMAQATSVSSAQHLDRLPLVLSSSPQNYCPARRSSLANSISTMSSPESMVSDLSNTSRSSSISSASSLASATLNSSLMQSRFRAMKAMNERSCLRSTISTTVSERCEEYAFSTSPDSYTGPVAKIGSLSLETPLARQDRDVDAVSRDPASDAARALQRLRDHQSTTAGSTSGVVEFAPKTGLKRSRTASLDQPLQDHVREMLHPAPIARSMLPQMPATMGAWEPFLPGQTQVPVRPSPGETRKRLCCSAEAASGYQAAATTTNHAYGLREPSFWGILN